MVTHVACRDAELGRRIHRTIEYVSSRFPHYFTGILSVSWDLTTDGHEHLVGCRIHSRTGDYRASARARDARQAAQQAFERLVKQRRREKRLGRSGRRETLRPTEDRPSAF
jgi:ribosome-associated translation inhibitor RaiA